MRRFVPSIPQLIGFVLLLMFVGCAQEGERSAEATPTPLPTPVVAEKPEYIVESGSVIRQLEYTGRISPVTEQELFFRSDGFVDTVLVARGDTVQTGDIIAQLDISELDAQLASAKLSLETAQTTLDKAVQDNADALAEAQISLENAQLALRTAQVAANSGSQTNQDRLAETQLQVQSAQVSLQIASANRENAVQEQADSLREAQLSMATASNNLDKSKAGVDDANVTQAEINLSRARTRSADAEREYQEALDRSWATEDEVNSYRDQRDAANEDLRIAQAEYDAAISADASQSFDDQNLVYEVQTNQLRIEQAQRSLAPTYDLEVRKAQLDLQLQQRNLTELQRGADPSLALDIEKAVLDVTLQELKLAQLGRGVDPLLALDVRKAELEIADIERKIADARLIAPFDGVILQLTVKAGDPATAFDGVAVLAGPSALEITAELTADQMSEMSVGQLATIALRNRPEDELIGSVRQLPAGYSGTTTTSDDDTAVRVAFDEAAELPTLEIGELATVVIVLEEKQDVVYLPPAAIRTFQGRNFVVVRNPDGSQQRVDVRVGIESDERVEILSGLTPGQTIIGE